MTRHDEHEPVARSSIDPLALTRYPASQVPSDGTIAFVECRCRRSIGEFRDGEWRGGNGKPLACKPTHWVGAVANSGAGQVGIGQTFPKKPGHGTVGTYPLAKQ